VSGTLSVPDQAGAARCRGFPAQVLAVLDCDEQVDLGMHDFLLDTGPYLRPASSRFVVRPACRMGQTPYLWPETALGPETALASQLMPAAGVDSVLRYGCYLACMAGLTIGKFAAGAGVGVETVRFYQRRGLLAEPERRGHGFREYSGDDQERLAFILRARQLGFTVQEIRDLLGPLDGPIRDGHSADAIIAAAQAKLQAVGEQVRELALLQCRLRRLVQVCAHGDRDDCMALHLGQDGAAAHRAATGTQQTQQNGATP
jgi:DNA-binding transcriptional MerR regulator